MECWIFSAECGPALFDHRLMDEIKENATQLRKPQAPISLRSLQTAITPYVEVMNIRLQAGLAVRETPTSFEVHELEEDMLPSLRLTRESNIYYSWLVKRRNET